MSDVVEQYRDGILTYQDTLEVLEDYDILKAENERLRKKLAEREDTYIFRELTRLRETLRGKP